MLRLTNEKITYDVKIEVAGQETLFVLKAMSIESRQLLLSQIQQLNVDDMEVADVSNAFETLLDATANAIVSIEGYDDAPRETLKKLEFVSDLTAITKGIVTFAGLSEDESKNLLSSSGRNIQVSAGSAGSSVKKENAHVSTTLKQTDQ